MSPIRLATRSSVLALWQAEAVKSRLLEADPGLSIEILPTSTRADLDTSTTLGNLGGTGVFTKEVDREVLAGRADLAVHSLKDQETVLAAGLILGLVLQRGPVEDALVCPAGLELAQLPAGTRVGTGSLRRRAQLLAQRADLRLVDMRGNVQTRLARLERGDADVLVMARAGLERLGLAQRITQVLDTRAMLPAPSQGIIGVTCRAADAALKERLAACDHAPTRAAALAERALLRRLEGGCNVPVGALAQVVQDRLELRARVLSLDGERIVEDVLAGAAQQAEALGQRLGDLLLERGAADLIREARS